MSASITANGCAPGWRGPRPRWLAHRAVRAPANLEARGCGLSVPPHRITAADITRLITDPDLAAAAWAVAAEMAAMPGPGDIASRLADLARHGS